MDNKRHEELVLNLEEARRLHEEILAAAELKRDGLVTLDLEVIRSATAREEELVELVKDNEKERREIVEAIADENGLDPEKVVRLREISGALGENAWKKIGALRAELIRIAGSIRRLNKTNRLLAEQTLSHLHGFLGLLSGAIGQDQGYGPAGGNGSGSSTSVPLVVDRKV